MAQDIEAHHTLAGCPIARAMSCAETRGAGDRVPQALSAASRNVIPQLAINDLRCADAKYV
jgi:hypothetical protein